MKTRKEESNYSITETPFTLTASQEVVYHYSKHSDASLILSYTYHWFTTCRTSVSVSPLACNLRVNLCVLNPLSYTASTKPLLGAIEPDKEAPYRAGPLGLCSGWQAAAQKHSYYWDWGIYRTSGWASSFSQSPSPPICLCGFIKVLMGWVRQVSANRFTALQ